MAYLFTQENVSYLMKKQSIPRYNQCYSIDLVFATEIVSRVMQTIGVPFISSAFAPCIGTVPESPLTLNVRSVMYYMCESIANIKDVECLIDMKLEDMTYDFVERYLRYVMHLRYRNINPLGADLLYYPIFISIITAVAYTKGLKKAPHMAVTAIRFLILELKMSEVFPIDVWEAINMYSVMYLAKYRPTNS